MARGSEHDLLAHLCQQGGLAMAPVPDADDAARDATFEEIRDAVRSKAGDPDALAAWIKDQTDPSWRSR